MDAYYLTAKNGKSASLCIAPITKSFALSAGQAPEDSSGYFLFEVRDDNPDSIEIIARLNSEDAAVKLADLLRLV